MRSFSEVIDYLYIIMTGFNLVYLQPGNCLVNIVFQELYLLIQFLDFFNVSLNGFSFQINQPADRIGI